MLLLLLSRGTRLLSHGTLLLTSHGRYLRARFGAAVGAAVGELRCVRVKLLREHVADWEVPSHDSNHRCVSMRRPCNVWRSQAAAAAGLPEPSSQFTLDALAADVTLPSAEALAAAFDALKAAHTCVRADNRWALADEEASSHLGLMHVLCHLVLEPAAAGGGPLTYATRSNLSSAASLRRIIGLVVVRYGGMRDDTEGFMAAVAAAREANLADGLVSASQWDAASALFGALPSLHPPPLSGHGVLVITSLIWQARCHRSTRSPSVWWRRCGSSSRTMPRVARRMRCACRCAVVVRGWRSTRGAQGGFQGRVKWRGSFETVETRRTPSARAQQHPERQRPPTGFTPRDAKSGLSGGYLRVGHTPHPSLNPSPDRSPRAQPTALLA